MVITILLHGERIQVICNHLSIKQIPTLILYLPLDHVRRRVSIHATLYHLLNEHNINSIMDLEIRNNPSGIFLSALGPLYLVGTLVASWKYMLTE